MEQTSYSFTFKAAAKKLAHAGLWRNWTDALRALLEAYLLGQLKGVGIPAPLVARRHPSGDYVVPAEGLQELGDTGLLLLPADRDDDLEHEITSDPPIEPLTVEGWLRCLLVFGGLSKKTKQDTAAAVIKIPINAYSKVFRRAYIYDLRVPRESLFYWLRQRRRLRALPDFLRSPTVPPIQGPEDDAPRKKGRRSLKPEIRAAYSDLRDTGEVRCDQTIKAMTPKIRARVIQKIAGKSDDKGLDYETIRTAIKDLLAEDRKRLSRDQAGA